MSLTQQQGELDQVAPLQIPPLAPWEYLWLSANAVAGAGGGGASAWWTRSPAGARAPDLQLTLGQSQMVDTGSIGTRTLWVAGDLQWITDSVPIDQQLTAGPILQMAAGTEVVITSGSVGISGPVSLAAGQQVIVSAGAVNITGGQGGAVEVQTSLPPVLLGSFTFTSLSTSETFPVPAGTTAIKLVLWASVGTAGGVNLLWVQGGTTMTYYMAIENVTENVYVVPLDSALESTVTVQAEGSGGGTVSVVALRGSASVDVTNNPNSPLFVESPSQGAMNYICQFTNMGIGAVITVVNSGVPISLWGWSLQPQPPGGVTGQFGIVLQDGAANFIDAAIGYQYTVGGNVLVPPEGRHDLAVPLTIQDGELQIRNPFTTVTVTFSVYYSL